MKLTRRELSAIVTAGAMSRFANAFDEGRTIGYCMVGLGRISMQHFMPALKSSKLGRVTALVSGHRDKAEKMAAEYGVPAKNIYSYDNYDSIAGNKDIDAVYIALPTACTPSTRSAALKRASTSSARSPWRPVSPTARR